MSDLTLVIGNKNYSSWSLRPWVFLRHNNIEFSEERVALFTETTDDELAKYNSDFKVPVLVDRELVIWDSLSILEYLSDKYPEAHGWPKDSAARALARTVSCEMHSSYMNVRNELPMNCRIELKKLTLSSEAEREIERITALWRLCRLQYGKGGEWLFGDYSIADAMFAPIVLRFCSYGIPLGEIEEAYVQSVLNQPYIKEWIEAGRLEKEVIEADEV